MTMLQKERWIFDASRGLKRDTKNPQQSDQDLRSFSESQNTVIEIEEDDIVVLAAKKKPRSRTKRHPVVPADEIDFSDAIGPAPAKKQRKGKISSKAFTSAEVFDDDFDMNSAKLSQGKRKDNNIQPPITAIPPKGPPLQLLRMISMEFWMLNWRKCLLSLQPISPIWRKVSQRPWKSKEGNLNRRR